MPDNQDLFNKILHHALTGKNAHAETGALLDGLDWKLAGLRPAGAPHSVFQLANHMIYWQEWVVNWFDGKKPKIPKHAAGGWPGDVSPAGRDEWKKTVRRFHAALDALDRRSSEADLLTKGGKMTRLEMLNLIATHNSYHAGQISFLRQQLKSWPPPSGGCTW